MDIRFRLSCLEELYHPQEGYQWNSFKENMVEYIYMKITPSSWSQKFAHPVKISSLQLFNLNFMRIFHRRGNLWLIKHERRKMMIYSFETLLFSIVFALLWDIDLGWCPTLPCENYYFTNIKIKHILTWVWYKNLSTIGFFLCVIARSR